MHHSAGAHRAWLDDHVQLTTLKTVIPELFPAALNATISACADGSLSRRFLFCPVAMSSWDFTMTHPTGTSPAACAAAASARARSIQISSSGMRVIVEGQ